MVPVIKWKGSRVLLERTRGLKLREAESDLM